MTKAERAALVARLRARIVPDDVTSLLGEVERLAEIEEVAARVYSRLVSRVADQDGVVMGQLGNALGMTPKDAARRRLAPGDLFVQKKRGGQR